MEKSANLAEKLIVVEGDLVSQEVGSALCAAFDETLKAGQRHVVLDLSQVKAINSYGIGRILYCYKRLHEMQGALSLAHACPEILELLKLMKLESLFGVRP